MSISKILGLPVTKAVLWSDSMNVLWWIHGKCNRFKPFVANRISEIQSITTPDQWHYVPTKQNPADLLSRGTTVTSLIQNDMWWKGPTFLLESESGWPQSPPFKVPEVDTEMKKVITNSNFKQKCLFTEHQGTDWRLNPSRYSNWIRLVRVQAWVYRFLENSKLSKDVRTSGDLTSEEVLDNIIKKCQQETFRMEYKALQLGKPLGRQSKLLPLKPKIDEDGLIRSDGRLKYAEYLSFDVRFPIILPRKHWVTKLIVKHYHEAGNHSAGTNQVLSQLSTRFWIISGREEIREWEKQCSVCKRQKAKAATQIMAPLPAIRVNVPLRAFAHTAVDFAGPFITVQGRGKRREKRYLCLFTCLASRAVHLEMAYGLDTDSFLNAFYRMASRRGLPKRMISDNGGNFIGANNELKELVRALDQDKILQSTANKGISWQFNPPLAPHFGGVHETMIKSAKKAIKAILTNSDVSDEELMTAFIGAEALINSRPLTYQSASPEDDIPLTPNHLLHGQAGGQFAPDSVDETDYNPRKRWRRIQELVRHFWKRWLREWMPGLTARKKWTHDQKDLKVGDIVLVISPDTPRGHWPLGKILEIHPGKDGNVRVAKVQVGKNALLRSITKLCPLECDG